ncbi:hypothetical protein FZC33_20560 [Labrys sp. KNU-23]|uniref:hypothetical protein n=1 Tax=Labrys sp. KNU-23 TaxID=2789216 RepID=UPI0011EE3953|nr:hypothetical protein [Labrys sp. KNU-23]QEN88549.1 hypothetical protein FZC33_20560 [Labrys sp. KNU-23]
MRSLLALSLLAGVAVATPALADAYRWQLRQSPESVVLAYEVPDTDDQPLGLFCEPDGKAFSITYRPGADKIPKGWSGVVSFSSDGGQVDVPMQAVEDELSGLTLEAKAAFDPDWTVVLGKGRTLKIAFSGQSERIKLAGVAKGAGALAKACGH